MSNDKPTGNRQSLLERIKSDSRFNSTISAEVNCALVLWFLEIKQDDRVEHRLMYGWVIPYKFSPSNTWGIADGSQYQKLVGTKSDVKYRMPKLTLYSTGEKITQLIDYLMQGFSLEEASNKLGISKVEKFGSCVLFKSSDQPIQLSAVTFCDAQYNDELYSGKNAYHSPSLNSPAFSIMVYSSNRENIFRHTGQTRESHEGIVIDCLDYLKNETNFDFKEASLGRLGCIEWLEFPFMDEYERGYIQISPRGLKPHSKDAPGLKITIRKYCFRYFKNRNTSVLISMRIFKEERIVLDETCEAAIDKESDFEKVINIGFKYTRALVSIKVQLEPGVWILWYEENMIILGAIAMSMGIAEGSINARTDWLDKLINSRAKNLVKEASKIERVHYTETISATNKEDNDILSIAELLKKHKLKMKETGAWFFQKSWPADQATPGAFQFWNWFNKRIANRTDGATVLIIDPYFDAPGVTEFIARVPAAQIRFVVLSNAQVRSEDDESGASIPQSESVNPSEPLRATRLRQACEHVYHLLSGLDVRILDLRSNQGGKGQLFHDRFIIVKDAHGEAIEGYHLSNSFQGAAKKYPLLITPIPANVLTDINTYADGLLSADPSVVSEAKIVELFSTETYRKQQQAEKKPKEDVFGILKTHGIDDMVFQASFTENGTITETASIHIDKVANILVNCAADDFPKVWIAVCTWVAGDFGAHRFVEKLAAPVSEKILERLVIFLQAAPKFPIPVGTQGTRPDRQLLPLAHLFKEEFSECLTPADRILQHPPDQYRVGTISVRLAVTLLLYYRPEKLISVIQSLRKELSGNALIYADDSELLSRAVIFYQTIAELGHYIYFKEELTPILLSSSVPLYRALAVQYMAESIKKNETSLGSLKAVLDKISILIPKERLQAILEICNEFVRFIKYSNKVTVENPSDILNAILDAAVNAWPGSDGNVGLAALINRLTEYPVELRPLLEQAYGLLLMLQGNGKLTINQIAEFWFSKLKTQMTNENSHSFEEVEQFLIQATAQVLCMLPVDAVKAIREELLEKKQRYQRIFNGFFMSTRKYTIWYSAVRGLFWIRALAITLISQAKTGNTLDAEEVRLWVELHQNLVKLLVLDTEVQSEIQQLAAYCIECEQ